MEQIIQRDKGDLVEIEKLTAKRLTRYSTKPAVKLAPPAPPVLPDKPLAVVHSPYGGVPWDELTPEFSPHPLIRAQQVRQYAATANSR